MTTKGLLTSVGVLWGGLFVLCALTFCVGCSGVHFGSEPPEAKPGEVWERGDQTTVDDEFIAAASSVLGTVTGTGPIIGMVTSALSGIFGGRYWIRRKVARGIEVLDRHKVDGVIDFNKHGDDIRKEAGAVFNNIVHKVQEKRFEASLK